MALGIESEEAVIQLTCFLENGTKLAYKCALESDAIAWVGALKQKCKKKGLAMPKVRYEKRKN